MTSIMKELINKYSYPSVNDVYLRPALCLDLDVYPKVFLVGYNPATPIHVKDLSRDDYIQLLLSHTNFMSYYEKLREQKGKTKQSPTRKRMNHLVSRVLTEANEIMLETNVYSYPTSNEKELSKLPTSVLEEIKQPFTDLLHTFQPKVIAIHGQKALQEVIMTLRNLKYFPENVLIKQGEKMKFMYPNGEACTIIPYRHLSRIENISYEQFQKLLIQEIKSKNRTFNF
ncbi:hypothetical protein QUF88_15495 [Bacillus sp. DX1.1]|uniref:hypothetical protein n=1 Tax=unclassified Bacillus (in: firmicutes) TaxID=185979 RepID=UPI002570FF63|nr:MULTISPECIES: hypothetical protein [unclassified Bacillus (in: firmicutes)]MDM5155162.1 hypothetical protein [Bacillus sp. DX1.1]WJE79488.1 hypothetical protein QRE67_12990 [Bacillus sp. DX3.1]